MGVGLSRALKASLWTLAALSVASSVGEALLLLRRRKAKPRRWPPVLAVMPLRGLEPGLREHIEAFLDQDYPGSRRAVLVLDSESDPAFEVAVEAARGREWVEVLVAGEPPGPIGGKVWALLRALDALGDEEVVAFCDSDFRPPRGWLSSLVGALLREEGAWAATGPVWLDMSENPLASAWVSIWLEAMAWKGARFLWGGSMAVRAEVLRALDVRSVWDGVLADDATLTRAIRARGGGIALAPGALGPCGAPARGLSGTARWAARQMFMARHYLPSLWRAALRASILRLSRLAALPLLALGPGPLREALPPAALWALSEPLRFGLRALVAEAACGRGPSRAARAAVLHALLSYPAWALMLLSCLASRKRRVEWRGRVYVLGGDGRVALVREAGKIGGREEV